MVENHRKSLKFNVHYRYLQITLSLSMSILKIPIYLHLVLHHHNQKHNSNNRSDLMCLNRTAISELERKPSKLTSANGPSS